MTKLINGPDQSTTRFITFSSHSSARIFCYHTHSHTGEEDGVEPEFRYVAVDLSFPVARRQPLSADVIFPVAAALRLLLDAAELELEQQPGPHSRHLEPGRWTPRLRLPDIDDVVWSVVSAVESVALVSFLCFFFVFCGCTI
ncbi:hypothetical protein Pfo_002099 [Paulownia fortunei]|nr:hypothetical protein Pfo_002099 [Paulownia fortunei]